MSDNPAVITRGGCWWTANTKSRAQHPMRLQLDLTSGRNAPKRHVRGKIVARAHVGFEEEDWRFLVALSKGMEITISDLIRETVSNARKDCAKDLAVEDDTPPVWLTDDWDRQ